MRRLGFTLCALVALASLFGCASAPPASAPAGAVADTPGGSFGPAGRLSPGQTQDVTLYAMTLVGTPYRYGGNTPEGGFDCSGLIGHVYKTHTGLLAPRTTSQLQYWGSPVAADQIRMGDLVVFLNKGTATHAGIYVGNNRFVHAPSTGGVVRLDTLSAKYWSHLTLVVRRP